MSRDSQALAARLRRLDRGVDAVRAAVNSPDPYQCPDAVAVALDALYDLWELWSTYAGLSSKREDTYVAGIAQGELAAALIHARGGKSHMAVEFGVFTDTISDTFYDHFGCWRWQAHTDTEPRFAKRDAWYACHVAHREVLPVLTAATAWLRARPELR